MAPTRVVFANPEHDGQAHERGFVERWIDRWERRGRSWNLVRTMLFSDEVFMARQIVLKDGRAPSTDAR